MTDLICSFYTLAGISPAAGGASPLPFAARVEAAARAGYRGVGLHVRDYRALRRSGVDDAEIAAILRGNGMRHVEVEFLLNWFAGGEAGERSRADEDTLCHMAEAFGARVLFTSAGLQAGDEGSFERLAESFAALCARAAKRGVTVGLEPCAWTAIGTLDEALALLAASGAANAGVFLDLWHLFRRGTDFATIAALDPALVCGVQLDDAARVQVGEPIADCLDRRLLPGEGDADAPGFVAALLDAGYAGPISVEVISDAQRARPLAEMARASHDAARSVIAAAHARRALSAPRPAG